MSHRGTVHRTATQQEHITSTDMNTFEHTAWRRAIEAQEMYRAFERERAEREALLGGLTPSILASWSATMAAHRETERLSKLWRDDWKAAIETWHHVDAIQRASVEVGFGIGAGGLRALAVAEHERLMRMRGIPWGSAFAQLAMPAMGHRPFGSWSGDLQGLMGLMEHTTSVRAAMEFFVAKHPDMRRQAPDGMAGGEHRLLRALGRLDRAVGQLWGHGAEPRESSERPPAPIMMAPAVQLLTGTRSTSVVLSRLAQDDRDTSALVSALADADADAQVARWLTTGPALASRLEALLPGAGDTFLGAVHAFKQQGPDCIRHMVISARELLTHLLRAVAPDDAVRTWHTPQSGVPLYVATTKEISRKARLAYLTRNSSPGYALALSKDRDLIEGTWAVLNEVAHSLVVPLSPHEAELLLVRWAGHVHFILVFAES
ncbi:hypothetical protein [Gemmatimonas sp.]|uniref:pPIWI-associating nuclease domain-containing protein n=1 Tax=Gemmatimonas sp. TaxID=1962908 RepID=UPI003F71DB7E